MTIKIFTKEITVIITLKYFPLLFKDTEITLEDLKSHCWKDFQRYSFLLFQGFSALL